MSGAQPSTFVRWRGSIGAHAAAPRVLPENNPSIPMTGISTPRYFTTINMYPPTASLHQHTAPSAGAPTLAVRRRRRHHHGCARHAGSHFLCGHCGAGARKRPVYVAAGTHRILCHGYVPFLKRRRQPRCCETAPLPAPTWTPTGSWPRCSLRRPCTWPANHITTKNARASFNSHQPA